LDYSKYIVKLKKLARRSVLLKGPSGVGKTYQFLKLLDGGWKGLYVHVSEHTGSVGHIDDDAWLIKRVDVPLSLTEKTAMLKNETSDFMVLMEYLRTQEHDYDFVFFDSLMNYAEALESYLKHELRLTGFDLWGLFGEKMKVMLRLLVSLAEPSQARPLHVIGTWGVEIGQDWEGKRQTQPIVSGKMVGPRIDYLFDDVLMLGRKDMPDGNEQYVMYTKPTNEFSAKISSPINLPPVVADPDLFKLITLIQNHSTNTQASMPSPSTKGTTNE
jgi:hypothetical protein